MPSATASWLTATIDDGRRPPMRADDLGDDVADRIDRAWCACRGPSRSVTAGLKCPPETCPNAKIAASRPSPKANGTTSRFARGRARRADRADRRVPHREEQERADQLRQICAGIHVLPPPTNQRASDGHTIPSPTRAARISSASRHARHRTSTSSSRSTAWSGSRPTAIGPVAFEDRGVGERLRRPR